jgi:exodeoxyribonuclease VII small subunit
MQQPVFEQSLGRLEEIVKLLERGDAPLDAAMGLFEEGTALVRRCSEQLAAAEQKVTLLMQTPGGSPSETPFDSRVNAE